MSMIPGLIIVRKPLETYLIVREGNSDREMTADECEKVWRAVNSQPALLAAAKEIVAAIQEAPLGKGRLLRLEAAIAAAEQDQCHTSSIR